MRPMPARRRRWLVAFAALSVALGFVVAAYLYLSAALVENECVLAGELACAPAVRRVWTAAVIAGTSVALGVAAAIFVCRPKRWR